jgi:F-box protein 9
MDSPEETNAELESFREQWRREVRERNPAAGNQLSQRPAHAQVAGASLAVPHPGPVSRHPELSRKATGKKPAHQDDDDEFVPTQTFEDPEVTSTRASKDEDSRVQSGEGELVSALDHYEKAVEKEAIGSLGDSLKLYRKAFRVRASKILGVFVNALTRIRWTTEWT